MYDSLSYGLHGTQGILFAIIYFYQECSYTSYTPAFIFIVGGFHAGILFNGIHIRYKAPLLSLLYTVKKLKIPMETLYIPLLL